MGKDKFVFKKEFLLYHDSAWYDGINNNIGEKESMQKIQKPKRMKYSKEDLIFEEAIMDDPYLEGALFENTMITDQCIDRLYLNKCYFTFGLKM